VNREKGSDESVAISERSSVESDFPRESQNPKGRCAVRRNRGAGEQVGKPEPSERNVS
jgi:hypothetical protein